MRCAFFATHAARATQHWLAACVVGWGLVWASPGRGATVLINGSFDSGPAAWNLFGGATVVTTGEPADNPYARLPDGALVFLYQMVQSPGPQYRLSLDFFIGLMSPQFPSPGGFPDTAFATLNFGASENGLRPELFQTGASLGLFDFDAVNGMLGLLPGATMVDSPVRPGWRRFEATVDAVPGQPFLALTFQAFNANGVGGDSAFLVDNIEANVIPEPELASLAAAALMAGLARRRRTRSAQRRVGRVAPRAQAGGSWSPTGAGDSPQTGRVNRLRAEDCPSHQGHAPRVQGGARRSARAGGWHVEPHWRRLSPDKSNTLLSATRMLRAAVFLAVIVLTRTVTGQSPDQLLTLGSRIKVEAGAEITRIDRTTGNLVSEAAITLTNVGDRVILPPFVVAVELEAPQGVDSVTVAGAQGRVGVAPWQWPWLDLSSKVGAQLVPGGTVTFQLLLTRPAGVTPLYHLVPYGRFNRDPLAVPRAAAVAIVNQPVGLDGTASSDPDGDALTFAWDVGDGSAATGPSPQHTFTRTGTFSAALKVTDVHGATNSRSVPILVTPEGVFALARTRVLAGDGQPLAGVLSEQTSAAGTTLLPATAGDGYLSLGGSPGAHTWRFSKQGHLTVWRHQTLADRQLGFVPSPWLTPLAKETVALTPLFDRLLRANGEMVVVKVPQGAASTSGGDATLTALGPQALPLPLPLGWSPVAALHLDLGSVTLSKPAELTITPASPLRASAPRVLVRFDEAALRWVAEAMLLPAAPLAFDLTSAGTFALVLPDTAPTAPPDAVPGTPLAGFAGPVPDLAGLTGQAVVDPNPGTASTDPAAVIGAATVLFTSPSPVPSGVFFRTDVDETYTFRDGTELPGAPYDTSIFAYRQPSGGAATAVTAEFPIRPSEALGPEVLAEAVVHARVQSPGSLSAAIIATAGGSASLGNLRLDAAPGAFPRMGVLELRDVELAGLKSLLGSLKGVRVFDLNLDGLSAGRTLVPSFTGLAPNADFLLTQVVRTAHHSGLEPVLRLRSSADGRSTLLEPATGPRLPGITTSGRFALVQLDASVALVAGLGRNAANQPTAGLLARIGGQPWLALTRAGGVFALVAPPGAGVATLEDDLSEDSGSAPFALVDPNAVATVDIALAGGGLRVATVTPAAAATAVPVITEVRVRFNRTLAPTSFSPNAVVLHGSANQNIPASLSLNLAGNEVTLLPSSPLAFSATYRIVVDATLRDLAGQPLAGTREFSFTTAGQPARAGSELVIYEPGAANVPQEILGRLVQYTPGPSSKQVIVSGGPGVAEARAAVTLVNITSGETTTVISRPDGSFTDWLRAETEDYIQAVILNSNGTRTTLNATRQLFDDGRVGLYGPGGLLTENGGGGPVEIEIAPGTVRTRTEFEITPLTVEQINTELGGIQPAGGGKIAAGARLTIRGDLPAGDAEVAFPLDPVTLAFGPGESAEKGAFALCSVEYIDGDPVFRVLDQMTFANGRLSTKSQAVGRGRMPRDYGSFLIQFFAGLFGGNVTPDQRYGTYLAAYLGQNPTRIGGKVSVQRGALVEDVRAPTGPPLAGASVFAYKPNGENQNSRDQFGRIPGWIFATSGPDGWYGLLVAGSPHAYAVAATHPRFRDARVGGAVAAGDISSFRNIIFSEESELLLDTTLESTHLPLFPEAGQEVVLTITASRGGGTAPQVALPLIDSLLALQPGVTFQAVSGGASADVTITPVAPVATDSQVRAPFRIKTLKALRVTLELKATAPGAMTVIRRHVIDFNGAPPFDGTGKPSDTKERMPPQVAGSHPRPAEFLMHGQPLELWFSEPVDRSVLNQLPLITLAEGVSVGGATPPPVPGSSTATLAGDGRHLKLWFGGIKPGKVYTLTVPPGAVMDLNGTPLDQNPGTKTIPDPFSLVFRSAEQSPVPHPVLSDLTRARGGGVLLGSLLFAGEDEGVGAVGSGAVRVFDISKPLTPRALTNCDAVLTDLPTAMTLIPDYSFFAKVPPDLALGSRHTRRHHLIAVAGGRVGSGVTRGASGSLTTQAKYLRFFEVFDAPSPDVFTGYDPVSKPVYLHPLVTSPVHSADSVILKMVWQPPHLAFLEQWSENYTPEVDPNGPPGERTGVRSAARISLLNVQEFITGNELLPEERQLLPVGGEGIDSNNDGDLDDPGEAKVRVDLNGDGDYTDPNEIGPTPSRAPQGFFGFAGAYAPDEFGRDQNNEITQKRFDRSILDFDWKGGVMVAVLTDGYELNAAGAPVGKRLPSMLRVFAAGANLEAPEGILSFANKFEPDPNVPNDEADRFVVRPKRVLLLPDTPVEVPLPGAPGAAPKYQVELRSLALVALSPDFDGIPRLAVIDVSDPRRPAHLHRIEFPDALLSPDPGPNPSPPPPPPAPNRANLQSLALRADGSLELQTSLHTLLLNPRLLLHALPSKPDRMHDAITGVIRDTGTGTYIPIQGDGGLRVIAELGRAEVVQTSPQMEFRFFPALPDNDFIHKYATAFASGVTTQRLDEIFAESAVVTNVAISRYRTSQNPDIVSTLTPPSSKTHYSIIVRAPGGGGPKLPLGLHLLNAAGWPLGDAPAGFAPTRALSDSTVKELGAEPDDPLAPRIPPLIAHRLSDNPVSKYYNTYVSEPIAFITEEVTRAEVKQLTDTGRHVFTSGAIIQAFLDPEEEHRSDSVLKPYASRIDNATSELEIGVSATVRGVAVDFVPGANPPPVVPGDVMALGSSTVTLHSGEISEQATDLALPSRTMPIEFTRTVRNHNVALSPFGPAWDFNYNQRLFIYDPAHIGTNGKSILLLRATLASSAVIEAKDLVFVNGAGRALLFKFKDTDKDPDAAKGLKDDPLVQKLDGFKTATAFYQCAEAGVFDIFARFEDGGFGRLTPNGTQYRYSSTGQLNTIIHRHADDPPAVTGPPDPSSRHELIYRNGRLREIHDLAVTAPRFIKIGYYLPRANKQFEPELDLPPPPGRPNTSLRKIARLLDSYSLSNPQAKADIRYYYDNQGYLERFEGPEARAAGRLLPSFTGRTVIKYLYDAVSHRYNGVAGGGAVTNQSAIYAAQFSFNPAQIVPRESDRAAPVVQSVTTRDGVYRFAIGPGSSASANDRVPSTITSPANRLTNLTFDPNGNATQIKLSGDGIVGTPEWNFGFDHANRLQNVSSPYRELIAVTHDTDNPFLRGRGNVRTQIISPRAGAGPNGTTEVSLVSTNARHDPLYNQPVGNHTDFNKFTLAYTLTSDRKRVAQIEYSDTANKASPRFAPFVHQFHYNDFGQLDWKLLPNGKLTTRTFYPDTGFILSENDTGPVRGRTYNMATRAGHFGLPETIDMPDPNASDFTLFYDQRLQITDWRRGTYSEHFAYDEPGNLRILERDVGPGQTYREEHDYDTLNRLKWEKKIRVEMASDGIPADQDIETTVLKWDTNGRLAERTLPGGLTETFTWNGLGPLLSTTRGSVRLDYTYDDAGNLREERHNNELLRKYDYDGYNRLKSTSHITSGIAADVEEITYVDAGREVTRVLHNLNGVASSATTTYDAIGRVLTNETDGDTVFPTEHFTYTQDAKGSIVDRKVDAPNLPAELRYSESQVIDENGFLGLAKSPLAEVRYTPNPNLTVSAIDIGETLRIPGSPDGGPKLFTKEFEYNDLDQLMEVYDDLALRGGSPQMEYIRRPDGLASEVFDGMGATTTLHYSKLGELLEIRRPNDVTIGTKLDPARRLSSQSDAGSKSTRYEYTANSDRLLSITALDGEVTTFANYDGATELPGTISRAGGEATISDQAFDRRGRLLTQTASASGVPYKVAVSKYDAAGRIRAVNFGESLENSAAFDYDTAGPLLSAVWQGPEYVEPRTVEYGYYTNGYLRSIKYPSRVRIEHTRDETGRLLSVTILDSGVVDGDGVRWKVDRFYYAGPPDQITNGPIQQINVFDERRRLVNALWQRTANGATIAELRYVYDAADRPIARQEVHRSGRTDFFSTDPAGRLTNVHTGARPVIADTPSFSFEGAGFVDFSNWASWTQRGVPPDDKALRATFSPGRWERAYRYDGDELDLLEQCLLENPHQLAQNEFAESRLNRNSGRAAQQLTLQNGAPAGRATDRRGNITATPILHRARGAIEVLPQFTGLTYDGHDRPVTVSTTVPVGANLFSFDYRYRYDGLRSSKRTRVDSEVKEETLFLYDGPLLIEEWTRTPPVNTDYKLTARYYYADSDVPFAADLANAAGNLRRFIYLTDHAGSVHSIADGLTGQVLEHIRYDAFGQPRIEPPDTDVPIVSLIQSINETGFVVAFSEIVLPPADPNSGGILTPSNKLVANAHSLQDRIKVTNTLTGDVVPVDVSYAEKSPLTPGFGSTLVVRSRSGTFDNSTFFKVEIPANLVFDEWGNPSAAKTITNNGFAPPAGAGPNTHSASTTVTGPATFVVSPLGNHLLFHGQYFDYETGFYYLRARHYDPHAGEFLQRDPVAYEDSPQPYAAFRHNPVAFRDPSGMQTPPTRVAQAPRPPVDFTRLDLNLRVQNAILTLRTQSVRPPGRPPSDHQVQDHIQNLTNLINPPRIFAPERPESIESLERRVRSAEFEVNLRLPGNKDFADSLWPIGSPFRGRLPEIEAVETDPAEGSAEPLPSTAEETHIDPAKTSSVPAKGLGNPFKNKTAAEIAEMFKKKGFTETGPDPAGGTGGYVNPATKRSYHIDPKEWGKYREPNHVDVNRLRSYKGRLDKKKLPYLE